MTEGLGHAMLVAALARRIRAEWDGKGTVLVDGPDRLAWSGTPPGIGGARPDIYARSGSGRVVIGEAKTADDIDNAHTEQQLSAYFAHLRDTGPGELRMAVPYHAAGLAFRVCLAVRSIAGAGSVPFEVTGWMFGDPVVCGAWHG